MYKFEYCRATSVEEALQLKASSSNAIYLAGGMTMVPTLKQRLASPERVISLDAISNFAGIAVQDGSVSIGAGTRHAEVAASDAIPALANLASRIGDAQVRNCGTIGGSLANSDPAADYPAAVLGLGSTIHTSNRTISGDDFFLGLFETALEDDELMTGVSFLIPRRAAYAKFSNPASRYAVVGVMVAECSDGIRVGVTGAAACAYRQSDFESALNENFSERSLDDIDVDGSDFNSDIHASAEYRAHLVKLMAQRAVASLSS